MEHWEGEESSRHQENKPEEAPIAGKSNYVSDQPSPQNPLNNSIKGRAIPDRVVPQTISRVKKVPNTSSVGILRFAAAPHLTQL